MGDYIVLAVGADGIKIFECANGEMLHGAKLLPNGVIEGGYDLSDGTNGNDIWYIYDNYTKFEFYTEDIDDGVDVYITLYAPSGKTYLFNYFSENTALQGDCYFGIEYFLFAPGSSDGLMKLESLRIDGVEEGFVPDVDVAALNASMITVASTAITAANVEDIAAAYAEFNAVYETLNFDMLGEFNMNALKSIEANLVAFENEIADIVARKNVIDQEIGLLKTELLNINEQISSFSVLIADKQDELDHAEERYHTLNEQNKERIRAMEEDGSVSYWEVLFKANDFSDFLDRRNMVEEIAASDQRRLKELAEAADNVEISQK
jgi:hypothetical protein